MVPVRGGSSLGSRVNWCPTTLAGGSTAPPTGAAPAASPAADETEEQPVSTVRTVVHPGWLAVSGPEVDAVVEAADRHTESLEAAAADGLVALLEALTAHGLSSAPGFVACAPTPTGLRVVARGAACFVLPDGTRVDARGRMPWLDVDLDLDVADEGEVVLEAPRPQPARGWRRPARLSRPAEAAPAAPPPPVPTPTELLPVVDLDAPTHVVPEPGTGEDAEQPVPPSGQETLEVPGPAPQHPTPDVTTDLDRPVVLAVLCPAGHPSPPHAGSCRTCGRAIPPQQPFPMPRPSLGVLRMSTGGSVPLDRGVLLGRAPRVNEELPANQRPHLGAGRRPRPRHLAQPRRDRARWLARVGA